MGTNRPDDDGVAAAIRAATWRFHETAEGSGFLARLTAGELGLEALADMTAQLWAVYAALEGHAARWVDDPVIGGFVDPRLHRRAALEADLAHLLGDGWAGEVDLLDETGAYVDRLDEVAASWGPGFVAHHYTRYLGDLSGGLMIGARIREHFRLDVEGVRFYRFDDIDGPGRFKDAYRDRLDATGWSGDDLERVTEEVQVAYRLNTDLLDGLAARHGDGQADVA